MPALRANDRVRVVVDNARLDTRRATCAAARDDACCKRAVTLDALKYTRGDRFARFTAQVAELQEILGCTLVALRTDA
jgi:hypothetical protein